MNANDDANALGDDFGLFLEELTAEPLEASRAAATAACVFTGGSVATAGSCGSSVSTASSFSCGTG